MARIGSSSEEMIHLLACLLIELMVEISENIVEHQMNFAASARHL
jgi:hypothetical protein